MRRGRPGARAQGRGEGAGLTAGAPDVAGRLACLILAERARLRPRDALEVLSLLLGDRVQVGDASRYV